MEQIHPVKTYRLRLGLSLEDLAKSAGTTRQTLSRIENGHQNPSMGLISRIIEASKGEIRPSDFFQFRCAEKSNAPQVTQAAQ